jgi:hypothetical protein
VVKVWEVWMINNRNVYSFDGKYSEFEVLDL